MQWQLYKVKGKKWSFVNNEWNCFGIPCCVTQKVHQLFILSVISCHMLAHGFLDAAKKVALPQLFIYSFTMYYLAYVNYLLPSIWPVKANVSSFSTLFPEQISAVHLATYLFPSKIICTHLNRLDAPIRTQCVSWRFLSLNRCDSNHNLLYIALTFFSN